MSWEQTTRVFFRALLLSYTGIEIGARTENRTLLGYYSHTVLQTAAHASWLYVHIKI